jgi:hypothetical protein
MGKHLFNHYRASGAEAQPQTPPREGHFALTDNGPMQTDFSRQRSDSQHYGYWACDRY